MSERHDSVIAEQLANVLSEIEVNEHQSAVIQCAVNRLNKMSRIFNSVPAKIEYQEAKEIFNYLMTEEEINATANGWNECRNTLLRGLHEQMD
ncbi:hypothetical protein [Salmonella phage gmqsjt-1]